MHQSTFGNQKAFTFIEVLFAIIILGIGMIMIAGILPVAIKQQADTRDDMSAKAVCEAGFAYLSTIVQTNPEAFAATNFSESPNDTATPQTNFSDISDLNSLLNTGISLPLSTDAERAGKVVPLNYQVTNDLIRRPEFNPFNKIVNSRVSETDPRYQYMAFYRRDQESATVRLIVVAMKLNNTESMISYGVDWRPLRNDPNTPRGDLPSTYRDSSGVLEEVNADNGPFLFDVEIENQTLEADRIIFTDSAQDLSTVGEGAFVIIAHSPPNGPNPNQDDTTRPYRNNGRVFQLGQQRLDLDTTGHTWDLTAAYDLAVASVGPDGIENTADDVVDGSMSRDGTYPVGTNNAQGTTAQAWVIGKGLADPSQPYSNSGNKYTGRVQDMGVLVADVPIR